MKKVRRRIAEVRTRAAENVPSVPGLLCPWFVPQYWIPETKVRVGRERKISFGPQSDLLPCFRTKLSMICAKERGTGYVEEQAHRSADDRGTEASRGGTEGGRRGA